MAKQISGKTAKTGAAKAIRPMARKPWMCAISRELGKRHRGGVDAVIAATNAIESAIGDTVERTMDTAHALAISWAVGHGLSSDIAIDALADATDRQRQILVSHEVNGDYVLLFYNKGARTKVYVDESFADHLDAACDRPVWKSAERHELVRHEQTVLAKFKDVIERNTAQFTLDLTHAQATLRALRALEQGGPVLAVELPDA